MTHVKVIEMAPPKIEVKISSGVMRIKIEDMRLAVRDLAIVALEESSKEGTTADAIRDAAESMAHAAITEASDSEMEAAVGEAFANFYGNVITRLINKNFERCQVAENN